MKVFLIFLFFLAAQLSYSQDLVSLYEDYIPGELTKNVGSRQNIEMNLDYYSEITPNLVYHYIKHLNALYRKKESNPDSNYLNQLRYIRDTYLQKRSSWAGIQIQNIERITDVKLKRSSMEEFYEDLITPTKMNTIKADSPEEDNNFSEFFNYLYFSKEKTSYDKTKNYFSMNQKLLKGYVDQLNQEFDNFDNYNYNKKKDKVKKDIKYWYLIGDESNNNYRLSTYYLAYELSVKIFDNSFTTKNSVIFSLAFNNFITPLADINNIFLYSDKPLPTFTDAISFQFPVNLHYSSKFSAAIGYQIALKPELEIFSYLKMKVGYMPVSAEYQDDSKNRELYSFTYEIISGTEKKMYVYKDAGITNYNNNIVFAGISTPFFYFTKNLYFEIGLDVMARYLNYDFQVQKQSVKVKDNQQTVESVENTNYSYKDNEFNFSPSFSFVIEPYNNIGISINNSFVWKSYLLTFSLQYSL